MKETPATQFDATLARVLFERAQDEHIGQPAPDRARLELKVALVMCIAQEMQHQGLTQTAAARHMGMTQPEVSRMLAGQLQLISERKLMKGLTRLGMDITLSVQPSIHRVGCLSMANMPQVDRTA